MGKIARYTFPPAMILDKIHALRGRPWLLKICCIIALKDGALEPGFKISLFNIYELCTFSRIPEKAITDIINNKIMIPLVIFTPLVLSFHLSSNELNLSLYLL